MTAPSPDATTRSMPAQLVSLAFPPVEERSTWVLCDRRGSRLGPGTALGGPTTPPEPSGVADGSGSVLGLELGPGVAVVPSPSLARGVGVGVVVPPTLGVGVGAGVGVGVGVAAASDVGQIGGAHPARVLGARRGGAVGDGLGRDGAADGVRDGDRPGRTGGEAGRQAAGDRVADRGRAVAAEIGARRAGAERGRDDVVEPDAVGVGRTAVGDGDRVGVAGRPGEDARQAVVRGHDEDRGLDDGRGVGRAVVGGDRVDGRAADGRGRGLRGRRGWPPGRCRRR